MVDIYHHCINWKTGPIFLTLHFLVVHLQTENTQYCGVEQLVARWAHNPKVVSSSLTPATTRSPVNYRPPGFLFPEASNACI
jgi:hypothetical protein